MPYDADDIRRQARVLLAEAPTWRLTADGWSQVAQRLDALMEAADRHDPLELKREIDRLEDAVATWRAPRSLADESSEAPQPVLESSVVLIHKFGGSSSSPGDEDEPDEQ
ncbi:CATRA system-associated protein [Streptomyces sp. NPDC047869]|uniref:CATRA system-associated protein n=1 Tax=Streptomyces sp. NPDC047869 TaxID=3154709 RepID=UPI0034511745